MTKSPTTLVPAQASPLVSVLMATADRSDYLAQALQSVINQSYQNLQIVVIGDGANALSAEIVYGLKDSRINYIPQSRQGLTKALNFGLQHCLGKYVARLDDDDLCEPQRIDEQVRFLEQNPDFCGLGTGHWEMSQAGELLPGEVRATTSEEILRTLFWCIPFMHSSLMFRRETVEKIGRYDERFIYAQDRDLLLRLLQLGKIGCLSSPLITYRRHVNTITFQREYEQKRMGLQAVDQALTRGQYAGYMRLPQKLRYFLIDLPAPVLAIKNWIMRQLGYRLYREGQ